MINYECPDDDKTYVHRIGRTGRAGASGIAITFVDWADRTRWKVINNVLGLPFEEPQETYSTSPNLFHDLGIDPSAKGRIVDAKPAERSARPQPDHGRGERSAERSTERSGSRPARSRSRQRLRNGVPVERPGEQADGSPAAVAADAPREESTPRRKRRRTRSRAEEKVSTED